MDTTISDNIENIHCRIKAREIEEVISRSQERIYHIVLTEELGMRELCLMSRLFT